VSALCAGAVKPGSQDHGFVASRRQHLRPVSSESCWPTALLPAAWRASAGRNRSLLLDSAPTGVRRRSAVVSVVDRTPNDRGGNPSSCSVGSWPIRFLRWAGGLADGLVFELVVSVHKSRFVLGPFDESPTAQPHVSLRNVRTSRSGRRGVAGGSSRRTGASPTRIRTCGIAARPVKVPMR
jgi:hypothetical protein